MPKTAKSAATPTKQASKPLQKTQASTTIKPVDEMEKMVERARNIERSMLGNFFQHHWLSPLRWEEPLFGDFADLFKHVGPKVDIVERDGEILVRAEVPGVTKDDLDISLTEDTVTLHGKTCHEEKAEKGDYRRMEISKGEFTRTLNLPAGVDGAKASATFKDGLLELTLPKLKKSVRHAVKINAG